MARLINLTHTVLLACLTLPSIVNSIPHVIQHQLYGDDDDDASDKLHKKLSSITNLKLNDAAAAAANEVPDLGLGLDVFPETFDPSLGGGNGYPQFVYQALEKGDVVPDVLPADSSFTVSRNLLYNLTLTWSRPAPTNKPKTIISPGIGLNSTLLTNKTLTPGLGSKLPPSALQDPPAVKLSAFYQGHEAEANVIVVLTDTDARSRARPDWAEVCHWIVYHRTSSGQESAEQGPDAHDDDNNDGDVQLNELGAVEIRINPTNQTGTHHVQPYLPPGPPPETGLHRYVAIAFTPLNGTDQALHLNAPGGRKHWGYPPGDGEGTERVKGALRWAGENGLKVVGVNFFVAEHEG